MNQTTPGPIGQHPCPACGYCPHCGRGGLQTQPYPWQFPSYPVYPMWISSDTTGIALPNETTITCKGGAS